MAIPIMLLMFTMMFFACSIPLVLLIIAATVAMLCMAGACLGWTLIVISCILTVCIWIIKTMIFIPICMMVMLAMLICPLFIPIQASVLLIYLCIDVIIAVLMQAVL